MYMVLPATAGDGFMSDINKKLQVPIKNILPVIRVRVNLTAQTIPLPALTFSQTIIQPERYTVLMVPDMFMK